MYILARGQRLADIKKYGIILKNEYLKTEMVEQVKVVEKLSSEDSYDLIIVIMRKNQVFSLLFLILKIKNKIIS